MVASRARSNSLDDESLSAAKMSVKPRVCKEDGVLHIFVKVLHAGKHSYRF